MKTSIEIINKALSDHPKSIIAFSGGGDSSVLLDLIYRYTDHRPPLIWTNTLMEYPETQQFIEERAKYYNAELIIATAPHDPLTQFEKTGWAMLGKLAARKWQQKHKKLDFKCNVSECCRKMKIAPARKAMKKLGITLQLTGQRGQADDALRGMRAIKDGAIKYVKSDDMTIANPLLGWTDLMIKRYSKQNGLPQHPAKAKGALTIGCMFCGGGAQFDNSGFKVLRYTSPAEWRKFIVDWKAGEIILAIKYDVTREKIRTVLDRLGGIAQVAEEMPYVFDYLRETPIKGYLR